MNSDLDSACMRVRRKLSVWVVCAPVEIETGYLSYKPEALLLEPAYSFCGYKLQAWPRMKYLSQYLRGMTEEEDENYQLGGFVFQLKLKQDTSQL
jgi:hypothetical protein